MYMYISMDHVLDFLSQNVLQSLKVIFILSSSADHDEMRHTVTLHLGHHYVSKYQFSRFSILRVRYKLMDVIVFALEYKCCI